MVRGYLEGALNRERSSGSRGGGSRWWRHEVGWVVDSKKLACKNLRNLRSSLNWSRSLW